MLLDPANSAGSPVTITSFNSLLAPLISKLERSTAPPRVILLLIEPVTLSALVGAVALLSKTVP